MIKPERTSTRPSKTQRKVRKSVVKGVTYMTSAKGTFMSMPGKKPMLVCGPIYFVEHHNSLLSGDVEVNIRVRDHDKEKKTLVVPRAELFNSSRLLDRLANLGFDIFDKAAAAKAICAIYARHPPKKTTWVTHVPGWQAMREKGVDVYVNDQGAIAPPEIDVSVALANGVTADTSMAGTLKDWNRHVGDKCLGNHQLQLAVMVALAAPLLHLSGLPNFGILLFGYTKTGKTVALKVASSVMGERSYMLSWKATGNALHSTGLRRNDALIPLDELDQGDPSMVGSAIYDLANGLSKSRMSSDLKLAHGTRFNCTMLASGESHLTDYLAKGKISVNPGQSVRMISVPVFRKHGVFHNLHGHPDGGELGNTLDRDTSTYFGTLGHQFIAHLAEHQQMLKDELPGRIQDRAAELLALLDDVPDPSSYSHIAKSFALLAIAGEEAISGELLAWKEADAIKAVQKCFRSWARNEAKIAGKSDHGVFQHLLRFFQSERAGKFVPWVEFEVSSKPTLAGYVHQVKGSPVFLVYPAYFNTQLCRAFGKDVAIRVLKEHELLVLGQRGTPTRQIDVPKNLRKDGPAKVSFYVISQEILRL